MALSIITLGADIATLAVTIKELPSANSPSFSVTLGTGVSPGQINTCDDCGGSVPHVHIWDKYGTGYGAVSGGKAKIKPGAMATVNVPVSPNNDMASAAQPEYVLLDMSGDDAICLTHVVATGNAAQWTWFGDMGAKCDADWYYSNKIVGDGTYTPKCVWLDKNHSKGLRYAGLGLHMPDFSSSEQGRAEEYQNDLDTLCKSTPRMKFYPTMPDDGLPPFFKPPLATNADGSDKDPNRVKDKASSRVRRFEDVGRTELQKRSDSNSQPGHLIISGHEGHSGTELCGSEGSYGPDFVSTVDNTYCDMSTKTSWPLCGSNGIKEQCFDLATHSMQYSPHMKARRDDGSPAGTTYHTVETWSVTG